MKYKYYLFKTPTEITRCVQCPSCEIRILGNYCKALKREVSDDIKPEDCPLVLIEGEVKQ